VYEPLVNLDTAYYCLDSSLVNVWIRPSNLSEGSFYWYASDTTEDVLDIGLSYLANDLKDDTVFYIRYEDSKGCINQNKYPVYVKAVAMPEVDFISDKQTVVQYEPIQFSAISRVADSWEWYFGEFDYAKAYSTNPVYSYSDTGRYHVQLQIKDQYGCVNSETKYQYIYVDRHSPVFVPDAFTPNADGLNDILYVRGTVESISFQLYNQWGEQIFQTEDLNIGWDGTFKGKPQAQGNYAYVLIAEPFSGDVIHKQGVVALIR
jgi:gliding motility-associated-like protein